MKKTNSVLVIVTIAIVGILSAIATPVYAHKLTATSYHDGYIKGTINDMVIRRQFEY